MNRYLFLVSLIISAFALTAGQNPNNDKNVVISNSVKEFIFVKGDSKNPVQIKQESKSTYTCNNFRTEVPIVEFYNDMEKINEVNISVNNSKKHGIQPQYDYYNSEGIFYSDARVCFFKLPLIKQGSTSEVVIKKTTLDPHYFSTIYFMAEHPILDQEIKLQVPSWMKIEIKEYNFKDYDIKKTVSTSGEITTYTYSMKNIAAFTHDDSAPGASYFVPHLLVMCKSAELKNEKYVYFNTIEDQYAWYRKLVKEIGNDEALIAQKTKEILGNVSTEEEKAKTIFQWVQNNIRYIAFEDGIAGFKPESAQEVLRKKYGDCKGMANLLTVMMRSAGLDARRCWIGTKHIAYDYSTPSLSVDNHMISAWMNKGKLVYLDATEKYIGFGEIAERIQNRQTLVENGDKFSLERVPSADYLQNTNTETRVFKIENNNLRGHVKQVWKGENKVGLLNALHSIKQEKQDNALKEFLSLGNKNYEISNLEIKNIDNYNADLEVEYEVLWKEAITVFDKEMYLDLENRRSYDNFKMDTAKRELPYWFDFKKNLVFETRLELPNGKKIQTLPAALAVKERGYSFNASYQIVKDEIIYKREIVVSNTELKKENFVRWNKDNRQLSDFYNQQIVLLQQ